MSEYREENIKLIKEYLQELLTVDYEKFETFALIGIEHRLFYEIYDPIMKMTDESYGDTNE